MSGFMTIAIEVSHRDRNTGRESQVSFSKLNLPPRFTLAKLVSNIDEPEKKFPEFYQRDALGRVKYSASGKPLARQFGAKRFVQEFIATEFEEALIAVAMAQNAKLTTVTAGLEVRQSYTIRVESIGTDVNHIGHAEQPKKRVCRGGRRRQFMLNGAPVDMSVHTRKASPAELVVK